MTRSGKERVAPDTGAGALQISDEPSTSTGTSESSFDDEADAESLRLAWSLEKAEIEQQCAEQACQLHFELQRQHLTDLQPRDPRPPEFVGLLGRPTALCKVSITGKLTHVLREMSSDVSVAQLLGPGPECAEEAAAAGALKAMAAAARGADSIASLADALGASAAMLSPQLKKVNVCKEHLARLSASHRHGNVRGVEQIETGAEAHDGDGARECCPPSTTGGEVVLLGWSVHSFNEWGRADERRLVLTSEAVYRCREDFNGHVIVCSRVPLAALCDLHRKGKGLFALSTGARDGRVNPLSPLYSVLSRGKATVRSTRERTYAAAVLVGVDPVLAGAVLCDAIEAARRIHLGRELA